MPQDISGNDDGSDAHCVPSPRTPPMPSSYRSEIIAVRGLRYTQRACRSSFRCGRPLQLLIAQLCEGQVSSLHAPFLRLEIIRKWERGRQLLFSNDNRRLYCLKQYQMHTQSNVQIRAKVFEWHRAFDTFLRHKDTRNSGRRIRVRGRPFGVWHSPPWRDKATGKPKDKGTGKGKVKTKKKEGKSRKRKGQRARARAKVKGQASMS